MVEIRLRDATQRRDRILTRTENLRLFLHIFILAPSRRKFFRLKLQFRILAIAK